MPGSLLLMLAIAAGVLLVPATVAFLGAGQHTHRAPVTDSTRRVRLGWAGALVGLGGLATTLLLGAAPVAASLVATLMAGAVVGGWRLSRSWAVRGIVVRGLLVAGAVGLLGWLADRLVGSARSTDEILVGAGGWLALVLGVVRLHRHVGRRIARRAQRDRSGASETPSTGPAPWLPALLGLAGAALVVSVTGVGLGIGEHSGPGRTSDERPNGTPAAGRSTAVPGQGSQSGRGPSPRGFGNAPTSNASAGARRRALEPTPSPPAPATTADAPAPAAPAASKTPGYEKDHPNRPDHAGSPGPGQPHKR